MIPQRRITADEVREHASGMNGGWGRWRSTQANGYESEEFLRPCCRSCPQVERRGPNGTAETCEEWLLNSHWTPLKYDTGEPTAGHEYVWTPPVTGKHFIYRARWNGVKVAVQSDWDGDFSPNGSCHFYTAAELARMQGELANRLAAGASDEYRIAVLRALIDNTMAKRGCGTVSTHFNPCAGVGFQWSAHVRSNVPREGDDRRLAGTNPSAESERGTELEALEALALFLGAAS